LEAATQVEGFWHNQDNAKELLQKVSLLRNKLDQFHNIQEGLQEIETGFELLNIDYDSGVVEELTGICDKLGTLLNRIELQEKMSGEFDNLNAFLEINAGGGGTDAQDWANMLLRMYLRWAEHSGYEAEIVDIQPAEVAGIKSATVLISGPFVYGRLRSEIGVHRLVRISPFNANGKRQTSFASVSASPEVPNVEEVEIEEKDLRIDTYRSSGAGGQHVNKTDSAVRITHIPTGIAVACQADRSQHKNKERAMSLLKVKLFEVEQRKKEAAMMEARGTQSKIDFGSQIRSYVLHPYKIAKDTRTGYETSDVDAVLDGEVDGFMDCYLLHDKQT
jgi:peptide chain release factor 2